MHTQHTDVNYRRSVQEGKPDNVSALDMAVLHSNWTSARLLVEAGADMSPPSFLEGEAHDWSPLMTAASRAPTEVVELMLVKGADPNYASTTYIGWDKNGTALHAAAHDGAAMTIRVLCAYGADVNPVSQTNGLRTPLHAAAIRRPPLPAAVSALVVAGADPFEVDAEGRTVVEAMVGRGDAWTEEVVLDSRPSRFY